MEAHSALDKAARQFSSAALAVYYLCSIPWHQSRQYIDTGWCAVPQELKQIMAENGGRFENYYCRAVTHIVCTNLPDSKVKHHAHERDPPPTVRPEWVVDSLAAGRMLPVLPHTMPPFVPLVGLAWNHLPAT